MNQELFKEMYDNIYLDQGQKDKILDCLEKVNYKAKARTQKKFHMPAIATVCACIVALIAVPVLAASPVLDRITQAFNLLYSNEIELTEEQQSLYSKYGSILDNEVKLNSCTLKLEAVVCDKDYICIPFSVTLKDEKIVAGEDIYKQKDKKLYQKILNEISDLNFYKTNNITDKISGVYTQLPSKVQDDGTLKGCYLLYYGDLKNTLKQGDTIHIQMPNEPGKVVSELTISKIVESRNIPVDKKLLKSQLLQIDNIIISPLSLRIDGSSNLKDKKTEAMFLTHYITDVIIELKDGTFVKKSSTGSSDVSDKDIFSKTILFEGPITLNNVAGVRIKGRDFDVWFPADISE